MIDLFHVKQRPGESLRVYLDCFNLAATEVKDPHEPTVAAALIDGVDKDTEFGRYLAGKPPHTRELFYEKANVHLRREEVYANLKAKTADKEEIQSNVAIKQTGDSSGKVEVNVGNRNQGGRQSGNNDNNSNGNNRKRNRGNDSQRRTRPRSFESYTPINDTLENIFMDSYNVLQNKRPPPRESTEKERETGKFCLFHQIHGHSTNECRHLRDVVEKLL